MNQKTPNRLLSFGIPLLVVFACVLFIVSLRIWNQRTMPEQIEQREQLKLITSDLQLDMSRTQVLEIIQKYKWTSFYEMENEIMLSTKPQLLATDWKVRLFFKDSRLAAIKYCNADNTERRPESAPPDRTK